MDLTAMKGVNYVFGLYHGGEPLAALEGYQVVEVINLPPYLTPHLSEASLSQEEKLHHMIIKDLASNPFAVLFQETQKQGNFLLAIRGTANAIEWFEDFRFGLTPFEPYSKEASGPESKIDVHKGFFTVYKAVRDAIFDKINLIKAQINLLTISGHSLGSAVAGLLSYDMLLARKSLTYPIHSILLATPRVGNKDFIGNLENMLDQKHSFRVLNNRHDRVPHVPPELFGYESYPNQMIFSFTRVGPSQGPLADIGFWHDPNNYEAVLAHLYDKKNPLPSDVKIDH